jgi:hypothetical protein
VSAAAMSYPVERPSTAWPKGCGVCRRTYEEATWRALPAVSTLPPASVQAHLSVPAQWAVELRRCACGAVLAARA